MLALIRPAVVLLLVFTALTGFVYPLVITGLVQIAMPGSANGSLIRKDGRVVGSALIGQSFTSDRYFRGRLSSAGEKGYDAAASSGSNLGPLSKKLLERVAADVAALRQAGIHAIPADAVTSSASGLDPDISPSFAAVQIDRVARTRNVPADRIRAILDQLTEKPVIGLFGEVRVNVLQLNLALDAALGEAKG
jgi:K+-transporting ATPase ATPase C chain